MRKSIPLNRHTKEYIHDLLENAGFPDSDSYKLFIHIFIGSFAPFHSDDDSEESDILSDLDFSYVPLPYTWLDINVPDADWRGMVAAGLLQYREYTPPKGKKSGLCREFSIPAHHMSDILQKDEYRMSDNNLVSSAGFKDYRPFKVSTSFYDENRNLLPDLIVGSMRSIEPCPFNPHALKDFLFKLNNKSHSDYYHGSLMLKMQQEAYHLPSYSINPEDGYSSYFAPYEAKKTGRIFESFGLQGASRKMRVAAFSSVPDIVNLDLRTSQALGLLHQFNLAGIKCQWLEDYCFEPGFQDRMRGELPKDLWKTLLYCLFFGGRVSPKLSDMVYFERENNKQIYLSAAKAILSFAKDANLTSSQIDVALAHFCQATDPLRQALSDWKTYLITDYLAKPGVVTGSRRRVVTNPTGMKLQINELAKIPGKSKLKSALAAHLLQGFESAYIHHLTSLSSKYGFKVYSNQHDGLIVDREIPSEAKEEAKQLSGLLLAELESKPVG